MPTVTATADLVCQTTGLASTGTERAVVIAALNYVYKRSVRASGCYRKPLTEASLTAGTSDYTLGTSPFTDTDIAKIRYLTAESGGQTLKLEEVDESDLLKLQEGQSGGSSVVAYIVRYPTISFWPTPGSGTTINGSYEAYPLTLVESGATPGSTESTPSAFPAEFHDSILFHGAVARSFEFDNRTGGDAEYHWGQYAAGVEDLRDFVNSVGGVEGASVMGIPGAYSDWDSY